MPAPLKTEAIVLRSIRYGEADRILHMYTPRHGRLSAIAKGVRRSRSRFGARLEPFLHIRAVLHDGRSDLYTVTGVDTVAVHPAIRDHAATLDAAARACDAVEQALSEGIEAKRASIDDFRHVDGARGSFQDRFLIHTRAGQPCVQCGRPIRKIVVGGRGTYVCESCQPRPRTRRAGALRGRAATPPASR